jgi:predicted kinase
MSKLILNRPTLILLYGYPGAGKTYFARQLCQEISAAHVQGERIRYELFENPAFDRQENDVVNHLMEYMAEEFLSSGVSVVYDVNAARAGVRRSLRDMARKAKAQPLLVWFQIDPETAFARTIKRDKRKADDKYAASLDRNTFDSLSQGMQNPTPLEDFMVISGKHTYPTQRSAVFKKLYDVGLLSPDGANSKLVKPGLVNLVPNPAAGRVDQSRRNILIR